VADLLTGQSILSRHSASSRHAQLKPAASCLMRAAQMGSDHQALSYSGLPACENCRVCLEACPTGAITEERFLLHAERCLTWHNEISGGWPDWLPADAHHCLVGCLKCQEVCPQNQGRLRYESLDVSFDASETDLILSGQCENDEGIKAKLTEIGLAGYAPVLGRNLKALMNRQFTQSPL